MSARIPPYSGTTNKNLESDALTLTSFQDEVAARRIVPKLKLVSCLCQPFLLQRVACVRLLTAVSAVPYLALTLDHSTVR
jgi:hypothetical protein